MYFCRSGLASITMCFSSPWVSLNSHTFLYIGSLRYCLIDIWLIKLWINLGVHLRYFFSTSQILSAFATCYVIHLVLLVLFIFVLLFLIPCDINCFLMSGSLRHPAVRQTMCCIYVQVHTLI